METKKIWITCIIALLVSGTAVAIVATGVNHYKKLATVTDVEGGNWSSEPIMVVNESQDQKEPVFGNLSKEEAGKTRAEAEMEKWIEIANNDSRVQELTKGKGIKYKKEAEYPLLSVIKTGAKGKIVPIGKPTDTVILTFEAEGKYYKVTINLSGETVESVEEQSSGRTEIWSGEG